MYVALKCITGCITALACYVTATCIEEPSKITEFFRKFQKPSPGVYKARAYDSWTV